MQAPMPRAKLRADAVYDYDVYYVHVIFV